MQPIGTLFNIDTVPTKKKINSERAYILSQFIERLNVNAGQKYKVGGVWKIQKEVKPSYIAFKVSHLSLQDLYYLLSTCKDSKSGFEKCFWGCLKLLPKTVYKSFDKKSGSAVYLKSNRNITASLRSK
jgi:hypothetical protein